jgi:tetratricopeptide (TPR) repeat protein
MLAMLASSRLSLLLFQVIWQEARDILQGAIDDADGDEDVGHLVTWHVSHLLPLAEVDDEMWDSFRLVEAVHLLEAYSLVVVNGSGDAMSVTMHPLTHAWAKDRQELTQQQQSWLTTGCMIAISGARRSFWQATQQQLRPHLQALVSLEASIMFNSGPQLMVARILLQCGWLLNLLRIDKKLFALIQDLLTWLGFDQHMADEKWVELYDLTGRDLSNHGQAKQAVALLEQVVRIREQTLAEDHPSRLASQHALAGAYEANGQVKEAVALLEQVVRIEEQTLAEDHPSRLASQHALAVVFWELGYLNLALSIMQNVVMVQKVSLDEQHHRRKSAEEWLRYMESETKNSS